MGRCNIVGEDSILRKMLTPTAFRSLLVPASLLFAVAAACGSADSTAPAQSEPVEPSPTFVTIEVTSAVGFESEAEANTTAEVPISSRGAPREFPEILKQTDGLSIGPVMSGWQDYLTNSVFMFEDNSWDLCAGLRGNAEGSIITGAIVWTIGPPTPNLKSNEITFGAWSPIQDKWMGGVLGTNDGRPVFKLIEPWDRYSGEPIVLTGEEIPIEVFELVFCTDPRA